MKLRFTDNSFSLDGKTEFINEKGEIEYIGIYDFSYKKRIRILDKNNNEVAYIQFRVISDIDQITLFDKQDNQLAYIKLNDDTIQEDGYKKMGDDTSYKVIDKDGNEIMNVMKDEAIINGDVLKCIMCLYVFKNKDELNN